MSKVESTSEKDAATGLADDDVTSPHRVDRQGARDGGEERSDSGRSLNSVNGDEAAATPAEEVRRMEAQNPVKPGADESDRAAEDAPESHTGIEKSIGRIRKEAGGANASSERLVGSGRMASKNRRFGDNRMWPRGPDRRAQAADSEKPAVANADESAGAAGEVTDLLDVVRRQWWLIVGIAVGAVLAGAAFLSLLTPLYTARAELVIETPRPDLATLDALLPGLGTDRQSIVTQTAVLRSRVLLGSVAERLDLASDPEFNSTLRQPGLAKRVARLLGVSSPGPTGNESSDRVVNALANSLEVADLRDSRVISVAVTTASGDKSATIANTLVDEYIESIRKGRSQASSETSTFLDTRIAELQAKVLESEQRVEKFRSEAELLEAGGTTLIAQQLADLNGHIIVARAETEAARAQLTRLNDLVDASKNGASTPTDNLLNSPLMQELQSERVALEREIAELSSEYGPAHPRMVQLRADAADLENQIAIEIDKVKQNLRNTVRVAEAQEAGLERQVAALKAQLSRTNEAEIELKALEREAEANRQLLETLIARRAELGTPEQAQSEQPNARVISYAAVPLSPSFPQKGISMAGILIVAVIVALVVAFIREIRRRGFDNLEQLESASKLTALGFEPFMSSRQQKSQMLDDIVTKPAAPFSESMRTLAWQLEETMPAHAKTILVTSSVPTEGKSTTAVGLARTEARNGKKVLIIDADLRNPIVHSMLKREKGPGLRDVLEGNASVADVITTDEQSSLDVLTIGNGTLRPLDVFESERTRSMLKELRQRYDYIFVDSPPIAVGPDACVLSQLADTTILAVRWSSTPLNAVKYALRMLTRNGGHVTGAVLTMVEESKSVGGYYGYYGKYGDHAESRAG